MLECAGIQDEAKGRLHRWGERLVEVMEQRRAFKIAQVRRDRFFCAKKAKKLLE